MWKINGLAILFVIFAVNAAAQNTDVESPSNPGTMPSPPAEAQSAAAILAQLGRSFSQGQVVHQAQLSGIATWHAGSTEDSGPVSLTASSNGTASAQMSLSSLGARTEAQSGQGSAIACSWSGADGISHDGNPTNCWMPMIWFLPTISLQTASMPPSLAISDLGIGTVGSGTYYHLQSQMVFSDTPMSITEAMKASTADIGLDTTSLLPAVLAYNLRPESSSATPIAIEIRYGSYTAVNGVQIPYSIQRYVNGTLQLDISISNAQVN